MTRHWSTSTAPSSRLVNSKWSRSLRACGNGLGDAVHFCDRIRWGDVARIDARHASGDRRLQLVDVGPGGRCRVYLGCWGNSGRWTCNCPGGSDPIVAPENPESRNRWISACCEGSKGCGLPCQGRDIDAQLRTEREEFRRSGSYMPDPQPLGGRPIPFPPPDGSPATSGSPYNLTNLMTKWSTPWPP